MRRPISCKLSCKSPRGEDWLESDLVLGDRECHHWIGWQHFEEKPGFPHLSPVNDSFPQMFLVPSSKPEIAIQDPLSLNDYSTSN